MRRALATLAASLAACSAPTLPDVDLSLSDPCQAQTYAAACEEAGLFHDYGVRADCKHPKRGADFRWQGTYRCVQLDAILCCPGP